MTNKERKALAAAQNAEEAAAAKSKTAAADKPYVRTVDDRYHDAIRILPAMKRKQSSDQGKLDHIAHVEKVTGKKIK